MLAAIAIMVLGICVTAAVSQSSGYRLGGVMVLPLLVVYTFREPISPVVFVVATAAAWGSLWLLREYTLNHGRRVFLVGVVVGALVSIVTTAVLTFLVSDVTYYDAEIVGSIFPGIAAYNLMRLDPRDRRADLLGMLAVYVGLVAFGLAVVYALGIFHPRVPPVLLLPTSEAASWLGLTPVGEPTPHVVPRWLAISVLITDVVVYEVLRARYDLRLAGVILVPLLAVFTVRYADAVIVYALGATAVFFVVSLVHWSSLLYGRNLLAVGLVTGLVYVAAIGVAQPVPAPGITLFFVGLFTGIGAYNLHRVAPKNRAASIRLSAALFVVFYAVLLVFVEVPASGLDPLGVGYAAIAVILIVLAVRDVLGLERSTPDSATFARESVFADAQVDADVSDSPLVATEDEDR
ncbi:poly-gamma-glutamate biosynthesis protein PgsC/CapC [Halobacterium sp. KA-4]|uniref:poly-gamma-glutamate biosynthesis protein PgsC/CapC n=1 Tax=Halobacterium sp. KA-4 TaxID=2896367 RepID=UPI001E2A9E4B|nr:poly-gamma-glutamate biosynthesis protein PgsC/CapC [Halobacterium sp. KA-4]MCD2200298.1 poly-gamma-glutamate biosynthesis protein PgsC/CapC [Halobacterium sp. KA-4]